MYIFRGWYVNALTTSHAPSTPSYSNTLFLPRPPFSAPPPPPIPNIPPPQPSLPQIARYHPTGTHHNPLSRHNTVSHILSTINIFKSKGFSEPDFPRIAYLSPHIFTETFDPKSIEPVFEFLTLDLAITQEDARGLIIKCPHIMESDPEFCLKPTLDYLKSLGIKRLNVPTTLNAHLLDTRVRKFEEKMRFLQDVGFSAVESRRVCGRFPAIFGYGIENNLRPKYVYLVRDMKRDGREEVNKFPQYFGFSLEKRIKVRHLHLKQRNVDSEVPLNRILLCSDQRFYKKWK